MNTTTMTAEEVELERQYLVQEFIGNLLDGRREPTDEEMKQAREYADKQTGNEKLRDAPPATPESK